MTKKIAQLIILLTLFCSSIYAEDRFGYITAGNTVLPINLYTNIIEDPIPVGGEAYDIAITPDGLTAYVTCPFAHKVVPIDLTTNTAEAPILIDSNKTYLDNVHNGLIRNAINELTAGVSVFAIAIAPDGKTAYATNIDDTLLAIDLKTRTIVNAIPVGRLPFDVAITPDGKFAYVVNFQSNDITPIDLATQTPGTPIPVGKEPTSIAITPDGKFAYVTNSASNDVIPINIVSNTLGAPIPVGAGPTSLAITSDGKFAFVGNNDSDNLTPIEIINHISNQPIPGGITPSGIAITPEDHYAYVSDELGQSISIIDVTSQTNVSTIYLEERALHVAIVPDQAPVASFSFVPILFGLVLFDASASYSPIGSVVKYEWDFGDGTTESSEWPYTYHDFSTPGCYTATLTVTNSAGTSTKQVFTGRTMTKNGGSSATKSRTANMTFNILDKI